MPRAPRGALASRGERRLEPEAKLQRVAYEVTPRPPGAPRATGWFDLSRRLRRHLARSVGAFFARRIVRGLTRTAVRMLARGRVGVDLGGTGTFSFRLGLRLRLRSGVHATPFVGLMLWTTCLGPHSLDSMPATEQRAFRRRKPAPRGTESGAASFFATPLPMRPEASLPSLATIAAEGVHRSRSPLCPAPLAE